MKTSIAYKVCYNDGSKLHSAESAVRRSRFGVEYKTDGSRIKPKAGRLFIFDTIKNARQYAGPNSVYEIWEVEATNMRKQNVRLALANLNTSRDTLRKKWREMFEGVIEWSTPFGAHSCTSLVMKRKV